MAGSVITRSLISILYLTAAAIFVHQSLAQDAVVDNFLLVASRPYLYQIDLVSGGIISLLEDTIQGLVAVGYDPVEMVIYWTNVSQGLIGKNTLNGNRQDTTIIFENPDGPLPLDGLVLDTDNRKLYYADAGSFPKIVRLNLDGSQPTLIVNGTGMQPRALVLDPGKKNLYYTDWGVQPGIYVVDLSTHQSTAILTIDLVWPNALAIDFEERVMYWADASLQRVEMANLDGSERILLANEPNTHYYAMALSPQYLYITDWYYQFVQRMDRNTHYMSYQPQQLNGTAFGIVYYNSSYARATSGTTPEPDKTAFMTPTATTKSLTSGTTPQLGKTISMNPTATSGTTPESDKSTSTTPTDLTKSSSVSSTVIIIAAVVAGAGVLITGIITFGVCYALQRKST